MIVLPQLYMVDYSFHPKLPAAQRGGEKDVYTLENYRYFIFGGTVRTDQFNTPSSARLLATIVVSVLITILNFVDLLPDRLLHGAGGRAGTAARADAAADRSLLGQ